MMKRFGAVIVPQQSSELEVEAKVQSRWSQLLSGELLWLTLIVGVLALGSGLVLFGFNLWIPSNLRRLGITDADAILRKLPGALGHEESALEESFSAALEGAPEYPHYTRPPTYKGWGVPDVLVSGDHERVREWRLEQSRRRGEGA